MLPQTEVEMYKELELKAKKAVRRLGAGAFNISEDWERELVVTPFGGNYGTAGFVLALNGSPPRGVVLALAHYDHYSIHAIDAWRSRKPIHADQPKWTKATWRDRAASDIQAFLQLWANTHKEKTSGGAIPRLRGDYEEPLAPWEPGE